MVFGQVFTGSRNLILVVALLIIGLLIWATLTEVDEVSRGDGRVIPATRTQTIQATEPGVVKEIAVKLGQIVKAGQLIVRLDDTTTTSDLGEVQAKKRALLAKLARIEVEEADISVDELACPEAVLKVAPEICDNEQRLLTAKRQSYTNTSGVLQQRLLQRTKELDETMANLERLTGSLEISRRELALLEPMAKRKLVAETELIRSQREVNEISGQLAAINQTIPRIKAAIEEAQLQLNEVALQFRQDALSEKTLALSELSVLEESEKGESSRVDRTDIRSPVNGVINTMEINTVGSFVQPGATVAEIVPTSEELLVEARISPRDVAFIVPGQPALVKITAFDFSIYGGLEGTVANISPDSIVDQKTGEPFFEVRIKTDRAWLERDGTKYNITPGMVCSVDIITGRKTILHYLLKPLNKARQEALTER